MHGRANMSGSGGGGASGGEITAVSECAKLAKVTTLNSAIPKVVKTLRPDDVLLVDLDSRGSGRVEARTQHGDLAGSITYSGVSALRKCIEEGWRFVAIVRSVTGGDITVEVRPSSP